MGLQSDITIVHIIVSFVVCHILFYLTTFEFGGGLYELWLGKIFLETLLCIGYLIIIHTKNWDAVAKESMRDQDKEDEKAD